MDNLLYISCALTMNFKMIKYTLEFMDALEQANVIEWRNVVGGGYFNNNKDSLLHVIGSLYRQSSDGYSKILRLVFKSIIKHNSRDLLFAKNGFGTSFIDYLLIINRSGYDSQRLMDFSRLLCDECDIKESEINKSIEKKKGKKEKKKKIKCVSNYVIYVQQAIVSS